MLKYEIKNWQVYQHYKTGDRNPPWIKLHNELMTSRDWVKYNDDSKLLSIVCMMLASRNKGIIEDDLEYIQQVAHLRKTPDLKPLIDSGFLVPCKQALASASIAQASAIIEEKREEENKSKIDSPTIETLKQKYPLLDIKQQEEQFTNYCKAEGKKYKDYNAAFRNWCQRAEGYRVKDAHKQGNRQSNGRPETEAQRRKRLEDAGK